MNTINDSLPSLLLCCSVLCLTFALAATLGWVCAAAVLRAEYEARHRADLEKVKRAAAGLHAAASASNQMMQAMLRRAVRPATRAGETTASSH